MSRYSEYVEKHMPRPPIALALICYMNYKPPVVERPIREQVNFRIH